MTVSRGPLAPHMAWLSPSPPGDHEFFRIERLATLEYGMHIPKLVERPQNPIIDGLSSIGKDLAPPRYPVQGFNVLAETSSQAQDHCSTPLALPTASSVSWDTLKAQPTHDQFISSPFLSEQTDYTRAAARHYVKPGIHDEAIENLEVSPHDLVLQFRALVLGTSSRMFTWDESGEIFKLACRQKKRSLKLTMEGYDEITTESFIRRFLNIGTYTRRLERLIENLPRRAKDEGALATISAFAHAVNNVLMHMRRSIDDQDHNMVQSGVALARYWTSFTGMEAVLEALAMLCGRDMRSTPAEYPPYLSTNAALLSAIWEHVRILFNQSAPRTVVATMAYILTVTSRPYITTLCSSVGFDQGSARHRTKQTASTVLATADGAEDDEAAFDQLVPIQDLHAPDFLPAALVHAVPRAQQSLHLLFTANPEHPLLQRQAQELQVAWFWTPEEIDASWSGISLPVAVLSAIHKGHEVDTSKTKYRKELAEFSRFDLPPEGDHTNGEQVNYGTRMLEDFIRTFPERLPLLTPTPESLAELVFRPLSTQAALLSDTLVSVFLDSSTDHYIVSHLVILRSYLLITAPAFKDRLSAALFSSAAEPATALSRTMRDIRRGRTSAEGQWSIGLASGLTTHDDWPPRDSDLGYHLRTVIVDSLASAAAEVGEVFSGSWRQAETRLGFAIRDLPAHTGQEGWLSPHSLEALDCLYMSYTIPPPLNVFMTPDILSKYQRLFTFILRLLRVEHVCQALFNITRGTQPPLFATFTRHNVLFSAFRFAAHGFVSALSAYIVDGAVRAHIDPLLRTDILRTAPDVFALAARHAHALDALLADCLLRSGQRSASARLLRCMESVLELGLFAVRVRSGELQEYQAVPILDQMWANWRERHASMLDALKETIEQSKEDHSNRDDKRSVLQDLLLRLGGDLPSKQSH